MTDKIDEKWNGKDLPIYNLTEKSGKTWWVSNIGTFSELVPLVLVKAAFDERDKNIKELESKIKELENKIEYMKTRYDIEEDGN